MSQRVKLRSQRAEPRATESSGLGTPSQGAALGSYPELVWSRQHVPGWISDYYGAVTDMPSIPPIFQWEFFVIIFCLCHQDKKIFGWSKWMDEERQKNSLVWSS